MPTRLATWSTQRSITNLTIHKPPVQFVGVWKLRLHDSSRAWQQYLKIRKSTYVGPTGLARCCPPCIFHSWAHDMSSQQTVVGVWWFRRVGGICRNVCCLQSFFPQNMELKNEVLNGWWCSCSWLVSRFALSYYTHMIVKTNWGCRPLDMALKKQRGAGVMFVYWVVLLMEEIQQTSSYLDYLEYPICILFVGFCDNHFLLGYVTLYFPWCLKISHELTLGSRQQADPQKGKDRLPTTSFHRLPGYTPENQKLEPWKRDTELGKHYLQVLC